jgi:hypothetical protein
MLASGMLHDLKGTSEYSSRADNQFWNVRLASKNFNTPSNSAVNSTVSLLEITPANAESRFPSTSDFEITPAELKDRQEKMEIKVQQIWHVLSGYEESSAALIGEMLTSRFSLPSLMIWRLSSPWLVLKVSHTLRPC